MSNQQRIVFCNCTYAKVVPEAVKESVLRGLCDSGVAFDAVADLCEMSARRDPMMQSIANGEVVKIAACFPRAIKGLFGAANAPLDPEKTEVLNMRTETEEAVTARLSAEDLLPNIPVKSETVPADEKTPTQATQS